jgi:lysozyme
MPSYTLSLLQREIENDEGRKATVYRDSLGVETIGVGVNLQIGLYPEEIDFLRDNRIRRAEQDLDRNVPWWRSLSDARQRALANMAFNMGWPKLSQFKNFLHYLETADYQRASEECLHSLWASQVGARSQRIAKMIREG